MYEFKNERFLATFNDFNQVSISKVILIKSLEELIDLKIKHPSFLNNFFQFHQFGKLGEILLIQYAVEYANVFSEIQFLKLYQPDSESKNNDSVNAVMIFHDKYFTDQSSRVELYTFYLGSNNSFNASNVKLVRNFNFEALFSSRLGFDFKVTCLTILQKSNIAIFGISKIGLMFYSLDQMKVLKIERIATKFILPAFNPSILDILEVIPDSESRNF